LGSACRRSIAAGRLLGCYTVAMNDGEFLQHLVKLRLERERKEIKA